MHIKAWSESSTDFGEIIRDVVDCILLVQDSQEACSYELMGCLNERRFLD
jgi:hypothetical protein